MATCCLPTCCLPGRTLPDWWCHQYSVSALRTCGLDEKNWLFMCSELLWAFLEVLEPIRKEGSLSFSGKCQQLSLITGLAHFTKDFSVIKFKPTVGCQPLLSEAPCRWTCFLSVPPPMFWRWTWSGTTTIAVLDCNTFGGSNVTRAFDSYKARDGRRI